MTPSALTYLAYAVMSGFIGYTAEIKNAFSRLEACESCEKACPYGYKISSYLRELVADYESKI